MPPAGGVLPVAAAGSLPEGVPPTAPVAATMGITWEYHHSRRGAAQMGTSAPPPGGPLTQGGLPAAAAGGAAPVPAPRIKVAAAAQETAAVTAAAAAAEVPAGSTAAAEGAAAGSTYAPSAPPSAAGQWPRQQPQWASTRGSSVEWGPSWVAWRTVAAGEQGPDDPVPPAGMGTVYNGRGKLVGWATPGGVARPCWMPPMDFICRGLDE